MSSKIFLEITKNLQQRIITIVLRLTTNNIRERRGLFKQDNKKRMCPSKAHACIEESVTHGGAYQNSNVPPRGELKQKVSELGHQVPQIGGYPMQIKGICTTSRGGSQEIWEICATYRVNSIIRIGCPLLVEAIMQTLRANTVTMRLLKESEATFGRITQCFLKDEKAPHCSYG